MLRQSSVTWCVGSCVGSGGDPLISVVVTDTYDGPPCVGSCVDHCVGSQTLQKSADSRFRPAPCPPHKPERVCELSTVQFDNDGADGNTPFLESGLTHQPEE